MSQRVDRITTGVERGYANALFAWRNQIAVFETIAGHIDTDGAHVSDHHPDIGDRYLGHRKGLHRGETRVHIVSAREKHLFLKALVTTGLAEKLAVLKHVVPGNLAAGDLPSGQRRPFLGRHDTDHGVFDFQRPFAHDREKCGVDAILAGRDHRHLRSALAAFLDEVADALE